MIYVCKKCKRIYNDYHTLIDLKHNKNNEYLYERVSYLCPMCFQEFYTWIKSNTTLDRMNLEELFLLQRKLGVQIEKKIREFKL